MNIIESIKIKNFKRFKDFSVKFTDSPSILIGDNESGKSTILLAIDLVLSGSRSKVETYGLDSLFNTEVIEEFFASGKKYEELPVLFIELYLSNLGNKDIDGKYNSQNISSHGLLMICEPQNDLSKEIHEILKQDENNFPFEYYSISFKTFQGDSFSSHRKYLKHILLDSTQINNDYATRAYIKTLYNSSLVDEGEKNKHQNEYRKYKEKFKESVLVDLNSRISDYSFSVKTNSKSNLETDLTIREGNVDIENRGKGRQCFIKTDFALQKNESELDVILLEEPENHLSHIQMKKLILKILSSSNKQLIIATHSNLVSARLDLRKAIMLNSSSNRVALLDGLSNDTAEFFMKAPDNNLLEFILSKKVILVEGDAEFILIESFYKQITSTSLEDADVHVISVGGTSFKRYLEIAKLLGIKTAVIRDNDKNSQKNCIDRYTGYVDSLIKIFFDPDDTVYTFEIALYKKNKQVCDDLFLAGRQTLAVQEYMLDNKSACVFELLCNKADEIQAPDYIKDAILWIKS